MTTAMISILHAHYSRDVYSVRNKLFSVFEKKGMKGACFDRFVLVWSGYTMRWNGVYEAVNF